MKHPFQAAENSVPTSENPANKRECDLIVRTANGIRHVGRHAPESALEK